jgi:predicted TIM-barrel fold metal-dependent hydrolase
MHPYYQGFCVDEERMYPLYEKMSQESLVLVMHTGYDIGFPRNPIANPARIVRVLDLFPDLKMVLTHMGAWDQWDEVEEMLLGRPVWMECSYSFEFMGKARAKSMLNRHPEEYLLFGTDSPWGDQFSSLETVKSFAFGPEREKRFLGGNAALLLGLG